MYTVKIIDNELILTKKGSFRFLFFSDPAGARTQDPILKRDVLYQLSYWVILIVLLFLKGGCKSSIYFFLHKYKVIILKKITSFKIQ